MKRYILLIALCIFSLNVIHAEITWTLSNGTLTISGTDMPDYYNTAYSSPWYSQREKIKEIVIEDGVTTIGSDAFSGCTNLVSIIIPNSVTSIGSGAFQHCSDLTSITIPNSVTSIGNNAFYSCSGLTSITIPNSVTSIESSVFSGCSSLTSISIPNSVTSIGMTAFYQCSGLTSITIPNSVTRIEPGTFSGCSGLTSITIPNSVTNIEEYAFNYCSGLTSISIPNSVTSIDTQAFDYCSGLTSIIVEDENSKFDSRNDCNAIIEKESNILIVGCKNTIIPNSVTSIGSYAFSGCSGLTSITIPNSVTSIEMAAFSGCSGVTSIKVEQGNKKYDSRNSCNAIIEKESNTLIVGCNKTVIPNSVTSIGSYAFEGCSGLSSITIPNSVTSIGSNAFSGTKWYESQPDGLVYAGNVLYDYKGTMPANTKIVIKDGTKGIASGAFAGCSGLTSITIPNSVTSIGECAFSLCYGLTSVTIPNSVTSIGNGAFDGCSRISYIMCEANTPPSCESWTCFNKVSKFISVRVPANSVEAYKMADGWKYLTYIGAITTIILSNTDVTLWVGKTKKLTATVAPTTASQPKVIWSSSDPLVATVSKYGTIKAIGEGTCTITCEAAYGYVCIKEAICDVTVKQQITSVDFGYETLNITCGMTKTLTPKINPSNASVQTLSWKSKNTSVATVTSAGMLKAIAPGTAQIICTATDGFKKADTITVEVVPLKITDSKPAISESTYGIGGIVYTRTLTEGKYAAFCMPYNVNLNDYTDEFSKVYVPMGMAFLKPTGTLVVAFKKVSLTETIRAGKPFVALAAKSGAVAITNDYKKTFTALTNPEPTSLTVYNWNGSNGFFDFNPDVEVKIGGTYSKLTGLDNEKYYSVSTSGTMSKATAVSPYRIYVYKDDNNSNAKVTEIIFSFGEDEIATGIEDIINEQKGDDKYYNLNGQRINRSNAQKGIYIINGKKYAR